MQCMYFCGFCPSENYHVQLLCSVSLASRALYLISVELNDRHPINCVDLKMMMLPV
jgi:hypothetical protein